MEKDIVLDNEDAVFLGNGWSAVLIFLENTLNQFYTKSGPSKSVSYSID